MERDRVDNFTINDIIYPSKLDKFFRINYLTTYIGYATDDPYIAAEDYKNRTGFDPTIIIARPEHFLKQDHPLVVRSNHGSANSLLVSHVVSPDGISEGNHSYPKKVRDGRAKRHSGEGYSVPKHGRGRPSYDSPCPHCGGHIQDFNKIGYWYGWSLGIEPPYWEDLRMYVFRRDKYTCVKCGRKLPPPELRCHHVKPKESGGTDSARNLVTLCGECHPDEHPMYSDDDISE